MEYQVFLTNFVFRLFLKEFICKDFFFIVILLVQK